VQSLVFGLLAVKQQEGIDEDGKSEATEISNAP
jgi:hypothetical protein